MIDKLGDDKCFRGAYAYHLAVRDKINELVEEVNNLHERSYAEYKEIITLEERLYKLEQHKHETVGDAWKGETSEPIWMPNIEKDFEKLNIHNCDGSNNQPDKCEKCGGQTWQIIGFDEDKGE